MNSKIGIIAVFASLVFTSGFALAQGIPEDALAAPARPVTGRWDVKISNCSLGGAFGVAGARFVRGRHAEGSLDSQHHPFTIDLAMGYDGNGEANLRISGVAGATIQLLRFEAARNSSSPKDYHGAGTWGANKCSVQAHYVGPDIPEPLMEPANAFSGVWDLTIQCAPNVHTSVAKQKFWGGRAALGFPGVIEELTLQRGPANASIHLGGYLLWAAGDVYAIDATATEQRPDNALGTPYAGSGSYGNSHNCSFTARYYSE